MPDKSVIQYPVIPDHGFVAPQPTFALTQEEKKALGMLLPEFKGRTGLQGHAMRFVARKLIADISLGTLDNTDAKAITQAAGAVILPIMPAQPKYKGKIRPHVIERYQLRVNPNANPEQALWEIKALLANSKTVDAAPSWIWGSLLEAHPPFLYRMPSEDIAFAVTETGTVHTVVTRQGGQFDDTAKSPISS